MSSLPPDQQIAITRQFYRPFCAETEIERILSPQTARDYLLKLRADVIADDMRIFRYYRRLWLSTGSHYSLEGTFETKHYREYKMSLPAQDRKALEVVTFGDVFTREANGEIFNSPYGRITTISHSLHYFLEYSHLALLQFEEEIPSHIRFNALLIALRVMFQHEALDFDADPRGKIPPKVLKAINRPISLQLQFIAGHEFAHHLLGHLHDEQLYFAATRKEGDKSATSESLPIFNLSEEQEISADVHALMRPRVSDEQRVQMLNGVIIWFGALELYQHALDVISPQPPWKPKSHPSARTRHLQLVKNVETKYGLTVEQISESTVKAVESFKAPIAEFLSYHIDEFETYGSFYLDEPNSAWRGPKLIDRVDYY